MSEIYAMLTPRTVRWQGGSGGSGDVTWEMVCASQCALDRDTYLYALAKWSLDRSVVGELSDRAYTDLTTKAFQQCWPLADGEGKHTLGRLADLALAESIKPNICKMCNGSGRKNTKEGCAVCAEAGTARELSIRKISKLLDVSRRRAEYFWRDKLRDLLSAYQAKDDDIANSVRRLHLENS